MRRRNYLPISAKSRGRVPNTPLNPPSLRGSLVASLRGAGLSANR